MSTPFLPRSAMLAGRVLAWVFVGVLLVTLFCAAWIGIRGSLAYRHLERVQTGGADSISAIATDPSTANASLARLATDAEEARALTSDPVWLAAEHTPWIGPQLSAFRTVAASSDQMLRESLLPLALAAKDVSTEDLKPVGGHIDTGSLARLAGPAQSAATASRAAAQAIQDIDRRPLLGVVDASVGQARLLFSQVAGAVDALSRTSQLLPGMLGQEGPRDYLLLVQNNAEWRSLGGITGTAVLVHAERGVVSLVETASATGIVRDLAEPIVPLPEDVARIYGTRPARYFHNLTQIPDFTIDGPIAREMYFSKTGVEVDGVLAVDPVVLSYLLRNIGPIRLPTGDSLTSDNVVQFLLNEVYLRYPDPATQDQVFASAAGAVFQGLIDGRGSVEGMLAALGRASDERRLLVWSAKADEQALLEGTSIAGQLPTTDSASARFGVFLNDGTGSKMSYYVKPTVSITPDTCQRTGPTSGSQFTLSLTLTSEAPGDSATSLPAYITGGGANGTIPGVARVISNIYLPEGFSLESANVTDGTTFTDDLLQNRHVLTYGSDLAPGASVQIKVTVAGPPVSNGAEAEITPTADASLSPTAVASCAQY